MTVYIIAQVIFLAIMMLVLPLCVIFINHINDEHNDKHHLEPLGLPKGSIRSILALSIVGSFLITVALGPLFIDLDYFSAIIAAQSALVGSAVGFYFGSKKV